MGGIFDGKDDVGQFVFRGGDEGGLFGSSAWGGAVGFEELLSQAKFALEAAFGGVFVAQHAVEQFGLFGREIEGGAAEMGAAGVVFALGADALPIGLGGAIDKLVFERVFGGVIGSAPVLEDDLPGFLGFAFEDEGVAASAEFDFARMTARFVGRFGGGFGFVFRARGGVGECEIVGGRKLRKHDFLPSSWNAGVRDEERNCLEVVEKNIEDFF